MSEKAKPRSNPTWVSQKRQIALDRCDDNGQQLAVDLGNNIDELENKHDRNQE